MKITRFWIIVWATISHLDARTYVVSPQGNDANPGTFEKPIQTISSGARRAQPGDTVLVQGGVYRERITPMRGGLPEMPITYRAENGKRVLIKGSETWKPKWRKEGKGIYSAKPDDHLFDDRSSEYLDHYNPFKVLLASTPYRREGKKEAERKEEGDNRFGETDDDIAYTCGQIIVNDLPWMEVPLQEELASKAWWYDQKTERIWIHFGGLIPEEQDIEITTRRRLFAPVQRGLGHIVVEGFIFEHCGNQYPTNFWKEDKYAQKGAIGLEAGYHWIIRNNLVRYAKTIAIDCGRVDGNTPYNGYSHDNLIEGNYFIDNGSAGILSYGSKNLIIRNNVILRNNTLNFFGKKRWEHGGIKCHHLKNGRIEGNYIARNSYSPGIWLDNEFPGSRINRNIIHHNGTHGIFLEMSNYKFDQLWVDHNLIFENQMDAVYIHDASGATFSHNLISDSSSPSSGGQLVRIQQVSHRASTANHSFFHNLFVGRLTKIETNYPEFLSGLQRFDFNNYGFNEDDRNFLISNKSDVPYPWKQDAFQDLIVKELGYGKTPTEWMKLKNKVSMNMDEWKTFWKNRGKKNDLNSFLSPTSKISYDEEKQEMAILNLRKTLEGSFPSPYVMEKDFFGKNRINNKDDQFGPFTQGKDKKDTYKIWSGLEILKPHSLPAKDWNR
jgi:hypothetical protein